MAPISRSSGLELVGSILTLLRGMVTRNSTVVLVADAGGVPAVVLGAGGSTRTYMGRAL